MAAKPNSDRSNAESQLLASLGKLDPNHQKLFRSVRTAMRKRFPTANELAYEYPDSVVISYSPTERGIDGIVAIAVRADGVRLYLMNGPKLPDPKKLLLGSGKQTRFVSLDTARRLADPDIDALIVAASDRANAPLAPKGRGKLILQTSAAKRPARRKPSK